jgi:hypothetical protein
VLRFDLREHDGGTLLELTDTTTELGKAARDGAGWHECLDRLPAAVTLAEPPLAWGVRWQEVHPRYEAAFGPEASTIGPPEGHEAGREPGDRV